MVFDVSEDKDELEVASEAFEDAAVEDTVEDTSVDDADEDEDALLDCAEDVFTSSVLEDEA